MAPAVREGLRQTGERFMKVKAAQGLARILKSEGVPWVACYPTNHVNNALGEDDARRALCGRRRRRFLARHRGEAGRRMHHYGRLERRRDPARLWRRSAGL